MTISLWPDNLDAKPSDEPSPKSILEDAAAQLGERTSNEVVGEVHTRPAGDQLEHSFYLRATAVDYRYFLFKIRHTIDGFPVELIPSGDIKPTRHETQAQFEDALRQLFAQPHTREVVSRLRNLAREVG